MNDRELSEILGHTRIKDELEKFKGYLPDRLNEITTNGVVKGFWEEDYKLFSIDPDFNNRLVGLIYATEAEYHIHLSYLIVDPEYRGKGEGKRLVYALLEKLEDKPIILETWIDLVNRNKSPDLFWLKMGFDYILLEEFAKYYPRYSTDMSEQMTISNGKIEFITNYYRKGLHGAIMIKRNQ